jgi:hypothetical protein
VPFDSSHEKSEISCHQKEEEEEVDLEQKAIPNNNNKLKTQPKKSKFAFLSTKPHFKTKEVPPAKLEVDSSLDKISSPEVTLSPLGRDISFSESEEEEKFESKKEEHERIKINPIQSI